MKKNSIIYISIFIIFLLFLIISASYAYFTSSINNSNITVVNTVLSSANAEFMAYSVDPLSISAELSDFLAASDTPVASDNGTIIVKLASSEAGQTVHCTYDVRFIWDSTTQYTTATQSLSSGTYELSILGSRTTTGDTTGHSYESKDLSEINLTNLSWTGNAGVAGRYATLVSGAEIYSMATTDTTTTWTFTINLYSLSGNQSSLMNKNYQSHLVVTNIVC